MAVIFATSWLTRANLSDLASCICILFLLHFFMCTPYKVCVQHTRCSSLKGKIFQVRKRPFFGLVYEKLCSLVRINKQLNMKTNKSCLLILLMDKGTLYQGRKKELNKYLKSILGLAEINSDSPMDW